MRGQVAETRAAGGHILGEDGQRYEFMGTDWRSVGGFEDGMEVEFVPVGERATQVFAARPANDHWAPGTRQAGGDRGRASRPPGDRWEGAVRPTGGDSSVLLGWLGIACLALAFVVPVLPLAGAFIFGLAGASAAKARGNDSGLLLSRIAWIGALAMTVIGVVLIAGFATLAWPYFELIWQMLFELVRKETGLEV